MIRAILASLVLWPAMLVLSAVLWILGIPVCAWLAYTRNWTFSRSYLHPDRVIAIWPRWAWLWSNEEDGVTGHPAWQEEYAGRERWGAFRWSAIRNPSNNLRFVPLLSLVIDPARIQFVGNTDDPNPKYSVDDNPLGIQWAFTWQGLYAGLIWRRQINRDRHSQLRIGWKLLPRDRFGVPEWDHRKRRCGFGTQPHVWRKTEGT